MPIMCILIGPPASGKTTFRKQLMDSGNPTDGFWAYVNADELRYKNPELHERYVQQYMFDYAEAVLADGIWNIIIDNTNTNPRTVQRWKNLAEKYNYTVVKHDFWHVDFETCVQRDAKRTHSVGASVIEKMFKDAGKYPALPPGSEKIPAVIFDLDGTLFDIEHRKHFLEQSPKNWDGFFGKAILDDVPIDPIVNLYNMYNRINDHTIILVSGRRAEARWYTKQALENAGIYEWDGHEDWGYRSLFMRGFNDFRPDHIVKEEIYRRCIEPWYDVKLVFDDRDSVVNMWRSLGLRCCQVAAGNF